MADNINKSSIDDIVSGVRKTLESGEISEGGVRFEFVEDAEEKTQLVFEDFEPEETEMKAETEQEESSLEAFESEKAGEVSVAEDKEKIKAAPSVIWTTYVPRFTEVSENYRMKDGTEEESEPVIKPKRDIESPIFVSEDEQEIALDPTAELESDNGISGATLVTSGNAANDDNEDVSTVFKFDSEESLPLQSEESEQPTTQEEQGEEELLSFEDGPAEDIAAEEAIEDSQLSPEPEEKEEISEPEEDKPYVMPDPVIEVEKAGLPIEKPIMAVEAPDETVKKRKRSEFSSFSEKDGFYDTFIDSIMSVRVRILSVIFLSLMLLLLENLSYLGFDVIKFMHFEGISGAMAIITLPFVVGIFLLSLPEKVCVR